MARAAGLETLPPELLHLIVQQVVRLKYIHEPGTVGKVIEEPEIADECLRSLRLTSKHFAYSPSICEQILEGIWLSSDPSTFEKLSSDAYTTAFTRIAPYVTRINFTPPSRSWSFSLDDCKETIDCPEFIEKLYDNDLDPDSYFKSTDEESYEKEIQDAYDEYHRLALSEEALLRSEKLRNKWIEMFRQLQNVREVCLADCSGHDRSYYYWPIFPDRKESLEPEAALFAVAVRCLGESGIIFNEFSVYCTIDQVDWNNLQGWNRIDFSRLQAFTFRPGYWTWASEPILQTGVSVLSAVLSRCGNTLRSLDLNPRNTWTLSELPELPRLESLSVASYGDTAAPLADWVRALPSLRKLSFTWRAATPGRRWDWKCLLDTIRQHPNDMEVTVRKIMNDYHGTIELFAHHTTDVEGARSQPDLGPKKSFPTSDVCRYMSGDIEWNERLQAALT